MLYWALVFLVVAVLSAILGFGIAVSAAAALAKLFFYLFLLGFIVIMIMHFTRSRTN